MSKVVKFSNEINGKTGTIFIPKRSVDLSVPYTKGEVNKLLDEINKKIEELKNMAENVEIKTIDVGATITEVLKHTDNADAALDTRLKTAETDIENIKTIVQTISDHIVQLDNIMGEVSKSLGIIAGESK